MTTFMKLLLRGAACSTVLSASFAAAQTAAPVADGSASDDIIVTALRRADPLSRLPAAISVLDGDQLANKGVYSVADIANVTPGVQIGRDVFGVNINIRGVTTTDTTSKGKQGVSFNVDGVFIGRPVVQGLSFFDVARVEVLRGPQGTLYGMSSTGGAVNVITNSPTFDLGARAGLEVGNFNTVRGDLMVNAPLSENIAIRGAINFNNRDGFLRSESGLGQNKSDQLDRTGRLSALFRFDEDSDLRVILTHGHVGGVGPAGVPLGNFRNASGDDRRTIFDNPFQARVNDNFTNLTGLLQLGLGAVTLNYVGAHHYYKADQLQSSTNDPLGNYQGPPPAQPFYQWRDYQGTFTTDSHEIRLSNSERGRLDWVVGANWYQEKIRESDHFWNAPVSDPTFAASLNGINPVNTTTHKAVGLFGQGTLHFGEQWSIVGGLRWSDDSLSRRGTFAAGPGPWPDQNGVSPCLPRNDCIGGPNNGDQSESKLTFRAGVNFQANDNNLLFASIASGYKAGGFNDFDPVTQGVAPYGPESLVAYEVGYKGLIAPGLRFSSTAFYYDYKESQISSLVIIQGNFVIYTRLVPTEIYGWENELSWQVSENGTLEASVSLLHGSYKSFNAGILQNIDWTGFDLDKTPTFNGTFGYTHRFPLANGAEVRARAFTRISSSYLVSDFVAAEQFSQSGFTRSDASIAYVAPDDKFNIELFVTNIEDGLQIIGSPQNYSPAIPNAGTVPISAPRQWGLRAGFRF